MGHKVNCGPVMRRISWCSVDVLCHLLDADERDAVRGDLMESDASAGRALSDVLGLIVRRQAALWMDWRPWLAVVGVAAAVGALLSIVSRWWADGSAIYSFLYVNNWTWAYLDSPGARRDLAHHSVGFLLKCVTLICWSWTSGFVLGSLSRRTVWINGALFCLVLFGGTLGSTTSARNSFNSPVFSLTFYNVLFPLILRMVLVVLPALWGMRTGLREGILPMPRTIMWAIAVATTTALTAPALQSSFVFGWSQGWLDSSPLLGPGPDGVLVTTDDVRNWQLQLLPLIMIWPAAYMLVTSTQSRWRSRKVL
jgi:hypothetical protein